ncbi:unnamed protein product, partial [Pylaiella littoralis]
HGHFDAADAATTAVAAVPLRLLARVAASSFSSSSSLSSALPSSFSFCSPGDVTLAPARRERRHFFPVVATKSDARQEWSQRDMGRTVLSTSGGGNGRSDSGNCSDCNDYRASNSSNIDATTANTPTARSDNFSGGNKNSNDCNVRPLISAASSELTSFRSSSSLSAVPAGDTVNGAASDDANFIGGGGDADASGGGGDDGDDGYGNTEQSGEAGWPKRMPMMLASESLATGSEATPASMATVQQTQQLQRQQQPLPLPLAMMEEDR